MLTWSQIFRLGLISSPSRMFRWMPTHLDTNLDNFLHDSSVMRQEATVVKSYSGKYSKIVNLGGCASGWVGETDSRGETAAPKLVPVDFPKGQLYANPAATQDMLDDAALDLPGWLVNEIESEFCSQEGSAIINGNGVNKPKGFLTNLTSDEEDDVRAFGTIKYLEVAAAASIHPDELEDMTDDIREAYRKNAIWVMNRKTAGVIRKMKDANLDSLWRKSLQDAQPSTLLGYPVKIDEAMPDMAAGETPIVFGDFQKAYQVVDRTPLRVLRDAYTNKPFVHFYCTKRVSGGVVESKALRLLKMKSA